MPCFLTWSGCLEAVPRSLASRIFLLVPSCLVAEAYESHEPSSLCFFSIFLLSSESEILGRSHFRSCVFCLAWKFGFGSDMKGLETARNASPPRRNIYKS